jgi:hypothetical protein
VDRVDDFLVAGAAAQVARQRLPDQVLLRVGHAAEQVVDRHHQPGGAEPALDGAGLDERLLDRVQAGGARQPFDRDNVAVRGLAGQHQAGADQDIVEVDRAGAAFTLLTGIFRAGYAERVPEHVEQALIGTDAVGLAALAVDGQPQFHRGPASR